VLDDRDVNHSDRWEFTPVWKEMLVEGIAQVGIRALRLSGDMKNQTSAERSSAIGNGGEVYMEGRKMS
jgi:hypothetical protein